MERPLGLAWNGFGHCGACPRVDLFPENVLAWELYTRCWNQIITVGMGEVIGLNILAVYRLMESAGVHKDDELRMLDKLLAMHDVSFKLKDNAKKKG
jgi:hypothetical protein